MLLCVLPSNTIPAPVPVTAIWLVNWEFLTVMFDALPLTLPPIPVMPSSVKPLSLVPKLICICGVAPVCFVMVIALLVPLKEP